MERLSGLDASFLYMETSNMHMHVAFVLMCDASSLPDGFSFERIRDHFESRTRHEPAFRRVLLNVPWHLDHPLWVDDVDFDINRHVIHEALPAGAHEGDVERAIGKLMSVPLNRSCPLWEAWVISGLQAHRFAVVIKIHHAAVDGLSGTALVKRLLDDHVTSAASGAAAPCAPSSRALLRAAVRTRLAEPGRMWTLAGESLKRIVGVVRDYRNASRIARTGPMTAPHTHFNRRIGPQRAVALARVPLQSLKALKSAAGCTLNDVVLALCSGVLRDYLLQMGDLPSRSLIAMVPISSRTEAQQNAINNQVSGMWATLATDVSDPLQRLRRIQADTASAKQGVDAVGADLLQNWAEFNHPGTVDLAMRLYVASGLINRVAPVHNTIISNVPGPREPGMLAGARVETLHPLGPVMEGVGLNISLASYGESVCFALQSDAALVPHPQRIAASLPYQLLALQNAIMGRTSGGLVKGQVRGSVTATLFPT